MLGKIDRIEKLATSFEEPENTEATDQQEVFRSYLYKEEIGNLRVILDDLDHLNVTGAEEARQTAQAIRQRLAERSISESVRLENEAKLAQVSTLEEELIGLRSLSVKLAGELEQARLDFERESLDGGAGPIAAQHRATEAQVERSIFENEQNQTILADRIVELRNEITTSDVNVTRWEPNAFVRYNFLLYLPSDLVLALGVILCGGIGAIFAASRSRAPKYAKSIFNGLMAGFVAFLVIKGGRFLFLIEINADNATFMNPYAAAFAGILSGLFTEKAYRILSDVTDQIGERIVKAEDGKS